jgi:hypothetical protein
MKRSNECKFVMGNPLIGGFVETQHETKSPVLSGKTTEGLASPSDSHKRAKITSDHDVV